MLRELGQQLAAWRREAGLTQENLGALAGFSRSTMSVAEIGRQPHAREFWAACEKALDSGCVLVAGLTRSTRCARPTSGPRPARRAGTGFSDVRAWHLRVPRPGRG